MPVNAIAGTSTFTYNRDQIIKRALRQCGAIESGETPGAQEIQDAADALNAMVSAWQATGLHLWAESEAVLFLQPGQIQYSLGGTNRDNCSLDSQPNQTNQTTLVFNAAAVATTIIVQSTLGFQNGDAIGIVLADNSTFWTTITSFVPGDWNADWNNDFDTVSPGTVNLATGLPSPVAAGSLVFDYGSKIVRPLRIINARRHYWQSGLDTPMIRQSRLDYREMPNKTTEGTITQYFYDPQLTTGYVWIWPAPPDSLSAMKFTWMRPINDFASSNETPDFPQEWINAITWGLAEEIAPEYDIPAQRLGVIAAKAATALDLVSGWDREPESLFLGVSFDQTSR